MKQITCAAGELTPDLIGKIIYVYWAGSYVEAIVTDIQESVIKIKFVASGNETMIEEFRTCRFYE